MNEPPVQKQKHLAKRLSYIELSEEDDSLTLRGVPLLAEGTWHDSTTPYPTNYTADNLAKFTVEESAGYRSHAFSHDLDEEVGDAQNIRYDAEQKAIMADLKIFRDTQASRDAAAVIQRKLNAGKPVYVSIEMLTHDVMTEHGMEAQNITITGWIPTTTPACKKCRIPKHQQEHQTMPEEAEASEAPKTLDEKKQEEQEEKKEDEEKTLAARISKLEEEMANLKEQNKKLEEANSGLEGKVKQLEEANSGYETRVKALEATPHDRAPLGRSTPAEKPIAEYTSRHY